MPLAAGSEMAYCGAHRADALLGGNLAGQKSVGGGVDKDEQERERGGGQDELEHEEVVSATRCVLLLLYNCYDIITYCCQ